MQCQGIPVWAAHGWIPHPARLWKHKPSSSHTEQSSASITEGFLDYLILLGIKNRHQITFFEDNTENTQGFEAMQECKLI